MSSLTATRTVMSLVQAIGPVVTKFDDGYTVALGVTEGALFERTDESGQRRTLSLEYDAWDDMGAPHEITVTVEPGDRLNPPA